MVFLEKFASIGDVIIVLVVQKLDQGVADYNSDKDMSAV